MRYRGLISVFLLVIGQFSLPAICRAQATDPKIVEAAKKEGGEIEAYVTLRTDTAQTVWKMFESRYPFLKVKQYKAVVDGRSAGELQKIFSRVSELFR